MGSHGVRQFAASLAFRRQRDHGQDGYARELAPFGIETAIVAPSAYTKSTNHFAHAGKPADEAVATAYQQAWPDGFTDRMQHALAATDPPDSDPSEIGRAVAAIVELPVGKRPFRTMIDPADDGPEVAFPVVDRIREQFLHRIGFPELLHPKEISRWLFRCSKQSHSLYFTVLLLLGVVVDESGRRQI